MSGQANRKGSLGQEALCLLLCAPAPAGRNQLFVLWNKEQAWLDSGVGGG